MKKIASRSVSKSLRSFVLKLDESMDKRKTQAHDIHTFCTRRRSQRLRGAKSIANVFIPTSSSCVHCVVQITFVDPKVATKAQPPLPPSFPPPGRYPLEPPLSNQPPMSPLPSHQPALPSTQAMPSYDLPQSLGNPPSQPPSMPSRHQPRSDQMPPSQTPAWSSPQPFASSFPPPPAHPPGWTSEQPQPFYSSPTPSFTPLSPPPPPPPPPPQEFQQWQWQPSAPPPPPPPPPSEMPPTALTPNSNTSDNVQKGDGGGGGGDGGSDGRKPGTETVTDTEAMSWEPTLQKREQNDWSRRVNAMGKREWFNQKTGLAQNHRPDCLRKYR